MSAISELSTIHRTKAKTPEEKRLLAKEAGRDNKAGYLFLLPWLIGLVLITVGPMIASLYLSFTNYSLIQAPKWIGLDNYVRMLSDPRLHKSLAVTFTYVIVGVPLQLIMALGGRHAAERGDEGAAVLSVGLLPAVDARQLGGHRGAVAADVRGRRPGQPSAAGDSASERPHRLDRRTRSMRCGRSSCCTCGRSVHRW